MQNPIRHGLDWQRAQAIWQAEQQRYREAHPGSQALSRQAGHHLLYGVPLHWMTDWSTPFSLFIAQAEGNRLTDVDGQSYVDFCLGDTGAMFGHSPAPVAAAIARQAHKGLTTMLPGEDAAVVGELLAERFGLPCWQFAMTATDANRFVIRWARAVTGRDKVLVFNGCYHGTVDDVFVDLVDGRPQTRPSLLGQAYDLTQHTVVIEFNDLAALQSALAQGDVACVLAEPAMTNIGMVLPEPGFWAQASQLIREAGSLLVLDETHTISSGPGGYTQAAGLHPDMLVLGKPIGGGLPCAVYGFTAHMRERMERAKRDAPSGHSGIGTTLTANALAMAAIRATLSDVMTPAAYDVMNQLAVRMAAGLNQVIAAHQLPWCVTQVGARTEFQFTETPPRNGSEADAILDGELEKVIHLFLLNRGLMITPFHNMLLVCPATQEADVDRLVSVFAEFVAAASPV